MLASSTDRACMFLNRAKAMTAGMATISPSRVVTSAMVIPLARSAGLGDTVEFAITLNALTIPCTVPSSPSMGAVAPMIEM